MRFKNPKSGEAIDLYEPLWIVVLLLGAIYLLFKKLWICAVISLVCAIFTVGISWFFFPLISRPLIRWELKQRGWLDTSDGFGDVPINGTYASQIPLLIGEAGAPYSKVSKVTAIEYRTSPFKPRPSHEKVDQKLRDEAARLGANAVINVSYEWKKATIIGWGGLAANGWAVQVHDDAREPRA